MPLTPDPTSGGQERPQAPPSPAAGVRFRRRFMGAAMGGAGVLLAVQARSALGAGICQSPSATISGNTSPRPEVQPCAGGFSPGFWKQPQHFDQWGRVPAAPATFTAQLHECVTGQSDLTTDAIATPGTLVTTIFPYVSVPPNTGLWQVLAFPNTYQKGQLLRHAIAAWLNAGSVTGYPMSQGQVVEILETVYRGGTYCPPNIVCPNGGMDANDFVLYVEGMYDINTNYEKSMCAGNGNGNGGNGKKPKV